jgi:hypothetical protein
MTMRRTALLLIGISMVLGTSVALAGNPTRQFYGGWQKHKQGFAYRSYYYKPSPNYAGFKHHHVIQHPKHPKHLYFYNPYKKQFWGRCPSDAAGKPQYSLLAEKDRGSDLTKIPESAFPPYGDLPPIPESTDGEKLDLPPDDLPDLGS